ncbi:hypothetical protein KIL84_013429 [Mauremys mutica]|uniref:Uncharacterized protein n=1 Tax=Mauremys mutica TaxID=74926 RepID=A0A9D4ASE1_9SAUR|nr:hypothetical protein KIL84_013429 [Mauremys mutica]
MVDHMKAEKITYNIESIIKDYRRALQNGNLCLVHVGHLGKSVTVFRLHCQALKPKELPQHTGGVTHNRARALRALSWGFQRCMCSMSVSGRWLPNSIRHLWKSQQKPNL